MTLDGPSADATRAPGPDGDGRGSRAMRVRVGPASHLDGDPTVVVAVSPTGVLVDGTPVGLDLTSVDGRHAILHVAEPAVSGVSGAAGNAGSERAVRLTLGALERRTEDAVGRREVVVDGWRVLVEVEPEARAALRERARRGRSERVAGGPVDVRAIIPGRIVALNVASGDDVTAGQQLLVLEAMKMQNELRAPRDGTIDRVAVAVGEDVEVGDLLLVIR
ncbi:MAG TPA: acetyl-CoA carboxylase biotin carboxyl carrier protein subunit [Candidatus Limnocylindrales bacterium]